MFKEDLSEFFNDFSHDSVYSSNNINTQVDILINNDVEIIGEQGELLQTITTIDCTSSLETIIDGTFTLKNGDSYKVDSQPISNDGIIKTVSVIKQ